MSEIPSELKYTKTHEWVKLNDDGSVNVGITDHAQCLLGDIVFIEPPELDIEVNAEEETAVVESVKSASDIYAPVSGVIIEFNETLADAPNLVNQDPYGDGWIFRLVPTSTEALQDLLDAESYAEEIADDE